MHNWIYLHRKKRSHLGVQNKAQLVSLLDRLRNPRDAMLSLLIQLAISFDNNRAERDIRSIKVQTKISDYLRSEYGASKFLRIKSVISTVKKQAKSIFHTIQELPKTGTIQLHDLFAER